MNPTHAQSRTSFSPPSIDLFGESLEPALLQATHPRLTKPKWFRTDWQRSGALTGLTQWTDDQGRTLNAVVKLPIPPTELDWLTRLQQHEPDQPRLVPALYASGRELGRYDLAWAVMECLPFGPLDQRWCGYEWPLLADAAARFSELTSQHPIDKPHTPKPWDQIIKKSRDAIQTTNPPGTQRWAAALKTFAKLWKKQHKDWDQRDTSQWCHGDLHLGNAMTRQPPPNGPAVHFDLALVQTGHWIEDAIYVEHLYWNAPDRIDGHDIVKLIVKARRNANLPTEPDWPHLANLRRACLAAAAPAQLAASHSISHVNAALIKLEQSLASLA